MARWSAKAASYLDFRIGQIREALLAVRAPLLARRPGVRHTPLRVASVEGLCNPSILRWQGKWLVAARRPNYRMTAQGAYVVPGGIDNLASETWLVECDDSLNPVAAFRLDDHVARSTVPEARNGLEDPRLFIDHGRLFGLWSALQLAPQAAVPDLEGAVMPDWTGTRNTMCIAEIRDTDVGPLQLLPSPHGAPREKNWMPVLDAEQPTFLYRLEDMQVYAFDGERLAKRYRRSTRIPALANWSGSSQIIAWDGNWLCVAHLAARKLTASLPKMEPLYPHRFVVLDPDWNVVGMSEPFFFEKRGIEFCAGLAEHDGRVVMSYGLGDKASALVSMEKSAVLAMIKPVPHAAQ